MKDRKPRLSTDRDLVLVRELEHFLLPDLVDIVRSFEICAVFGGCNLDGQGDNNFCWYHEWEGEANFTMGFQMLVEAGMKYLAHSRPVPKQLIGWLSLCAANFSEDYLRSELGRAFPFQETILLDRRLFPHPFAQTNNPQFPWNVRKHCFQPAPIYFISTKWFRKLKKADILEAMEVLLQNGDGYGWYR